MEKYANKLQTILMTEPTFAVEEKINKNYVALLARQYDKKLLELLASDKDLSEFFFTDVNGSKVFKKDTFLTFINNKEFLPDSYTAFKTRIGLGTDADHYLSEDSQVVLNWPYKDCILEGGQDRDDQKRNEVFFNEILAPDQIHTILDDKVFTKWKRYDKDGEHDLDELKPDDNLIIKGNNLVVLHSLKKRFAGRVKLIYIDPPYNTGNDGFNYNDSFKHSTWLTFMRNRISAAKELLRDDGILLVSMGEDEYAYLRILIDEIFGRHNIVTNIIWHSNKKGRQMDKYVKNSYENILMVAKNLNNISINDEVREVNTDGLERDEISPYKKDYPLHNGTADFHINNRPNLAYSIYFNPTTKEAKTIDEKIGTLGSYEIGPASKEGKQLLSDGYIRIIPKYNETYHNQRVWRWGETKFKNEYKTELLFVEEKDGWYIYQKKRFLDGQHLQKYTNYIDIDGGQGRKELQTLFSDMVFSTPKPERLMSTLIDMTTKTGDIVLDFFLGSGTTAAVAHKMGRQYIGIEQMNYVDNVTCRRLEKVVDGEQGGISKSVNWTGGGSFVYCNIKNDANIFRERVRSAKEEDLPKLLEEVLHSSFLSYRIDPKKVSDKEFAKLSLMDKKRILTELVDNNTLYLNYSEINDSTYNISEADKKHNKEFYGND